MACKGPLRLPPDLLHIAGAAAHESASRTQVRRPGLCTAHNPAKPLIYTAVS
jgi:hypothetical protein